MQYDPFSAPNLLRVVSLTGLLVMMTEAAPGTTCLGIGLFCLMAAGILRLFSDRPEPDRPSDASPPDRPVPAAAPRPPVRTRNPPGKAPAKPAVEPHPAIFATVAGRTTGLSSRRRE